MVIRFVDFSEPSDPTLSSNYELEAVAVASELIDAESHELGVFDSAVLLRCFPETDVVEVLERIGREWHETSKRLHQRVEADDESAVLEQLICLSGHVDRFAKIASARYATVVDERTVVSPPVKAASGMDVEVAEQACGVNAPQD